MKLRSPNKSKTVIIILLSVVLVGVAGYAVYATFIQPQDSTNQTSQPPSTDDGQPPVQPEPQNPPAGTDEDPVRENPDVPANSSARVSIPNFQVNGNNLLLNVAISEAWPPSATCTLTLTGPETRTLTVSAFAQAQISGCQFEVQNLVPGQYEVSVYGEKDQERTNTDTVVIDI